MSQFNLLQTRRSFLKTASLLAAYASLGAVRGNAQNRASFPYVDGLCTDILSSTPEEFRASGLAAVLADVSAAEEIKTEDGTLRFARTFESCARAIVAARQGIRQRNELLLATRGSEIKEAFQNGQTAIFLQFQGGEPVGEDLSRIDLFYELGLRVLQITHHHNNALGGGAIEKNWSGLTKLGFEAVERMNTLGLVPDLSHASDLTAREVLQTSKKPVILSHGAARAIVNNARCTPDEIIRGVADSGGVMGIFMMSFWLTTEAEPTIAALIHQIRHVINVGGLDAAGMANDYSLAGQQYLAELKNDNREGVQAYFPWWDSAAKIGALGFEQRPQHVVIPELNNIRRMFTIHAALEKSGFKIGEIEKIMGGNWIRVLTEALG